MRSGSGGLGERASAAPKLKTFARQYTLSKIVRAVARARNELFSFRNRLNKLKDTHQELERVDYERNGRVKQQLHDEEEAIRKELSSQKPPSAAPTGMETQNIMLRFRIGGDIEDTKFNANFSADIGAFMSPYSNVGESLRPRRGDDIHDSQLSHRPETDLQGTPCPAVPVSKSTTRKTMRALRPFNTEKLVPSAEIQTSTRSAAGVTPPTQSISAPTFHLN
ncbi:MAG: hypothetical protein FJ244_05145 [Nitrospira sp.]|nr:hypothetical protein [Nitrospira sp.]